MELTVYRQLGAGFECPLRSSHLGSPAAPFPSRRAANDAVKDYQACRSPAERLWRAEELFLRHMLMLRRSLYRFCARSRCFAGGCLVEELVGETYPIFQGALDEYEPARGVDFTGFASRRMFWGLMHRARRLDRILFREPSASEERRVISRRDEERLLDRLLVRRLLEELDPSDAELLELYAVGYTGRELAEAAGMSHPAVRKKLQRLRDRLLDRFSVDDSPRSGARRSKANSTP